MITPADDKKDLFKSFMKKMIAFRIIAYLKKVIFPLLVVSGLGVAFFLLLREYSGLGALFGKMVAFYVFFFLIVFVICFDKNERKKIFAFMKSKIGARK